MGCLANEFMLHHLSLAVSDLQRSARFYDAVLAALGYRRVAESAQFVGYGIEDGKDRFALKFRDGTVAPAPGFHLAFTAPDHGSVDAFFNAGLSHGGSDAGPAGLRPDYGPSYYAAFLDDPDGHRIEAVHKDGVERNGASAAT